ncbi:unnamed protein product [Phaeothamnion confervicola]
MRAVLIFTLISTALVHRGCAFLPRTRISLAKPINVFAMSASTEAKKDIPAARATLVSAARNRDQEPEAILDAIALLEKEGRTKGARTQSGSGTPRFDKLTTNGNWQLVFTTGDVKTQKKLGTKINYVPIKAVQVFKSDKTITNGIYVGSFPLLLFSGTFTWNEAQSRLNFTFDAVSVLGLSFPFKQGEAKVQPGFTFADIGDEYVIARGAGGGLALWLRVDNV